jgi:hypothetical protein
LHIDLNADEETLMASLDLDLFRSCKRNRRKPDDIATSHASDSGAGTLYPDYVGFPRKDGTFRGPDVTTFTKNQETWIRGVDDVDPSSGRSFVKAGEGVSLNTAAGKFGYTLWYYFLLPKGTEVPAGLDVVQTGSDKSHYSIRCRNAMTKTAYQGALDNMARSAIAQSVEQKRSSLYFKE